MKILVTDANDILGRNCCQRFVLSGHAVLTKDLHGDMDYIGDLSNPEYVSSLPMPDAVVNCAAVQCVSKKLPFLIENIILK